MITKQNHAGGRSSLVHHSDNGMGGGTGTKCKSNADALVNGGRRDWNRAIVIVRHNDRASLNDIERSLSSLRRREIQIFPLWVTRLWCGRKGIFLDIS